MQLIRNIATGEVASFMDDPGPDSNVQLVAGEGQERIEVPGTTRQEFEDRADQEASRKAGKPTRAGRIVYRGRAGEAIAQAAVEVELPIEVPVEPTLDQVLAQLEADKGPQAAVTTADLRTAYTKLRGAPRSAGRA